MFENIYGAEIERGKEFGVLDIQNVLPQEWLEGQQLVVTLTDEDMNKDSTVAEKILFPTAYDIVYEEHPELPPSEFLYKKLGGMPYISTTNIELGYQTNAMFDSTVLNPIGSAVGYEAEAVFFSNFEIPVNTGSVIFFENAIKYSEITQYVTEPNVKHFINYDVSSLTQNLASGGISSFTITLEDNYESVVLVDSTSTFQNYYEIDNSKILEIKDNLHTDVNDDTLDLKITLQGVQTNTKYEPKTNLPFAFDVFRFGSTTNPQSLDDYVLEYTFRLELEETGIDTGVFTGTIAYERITQKNIESFDFSQLDTFGKDIVVPTFPDAHSEKSPRINYFDLGQDGIITLIADQQELLSLAEIPDITITTNEDTPVSFPLGVDDITISYDISAINTQKGKLTQDGFEFTYTPWDDVFGTDEIQLQIWEDMFGDARHSHPFNATITITNVNDPPTASSGGVVTNEDTPVPITLSGNDIDEDSLTFSVVTNPSGGTLSGTAPNLNYSPNPDFEGTDSFTFKVNDGTVDSSVETATITVSPINDIPIANAGSDQSVNPSSSVTLDGSQSSDVDGDSITYSWIQTSGTPVTLSDTAIVNPQLSTPSTEDTLSFMLTVSDGIATSNPDVVNVYVGSPVPEPIAPPSPTDIVSSSDDGKVTVSWKKPSDDGGSPIQDYIIEYKEKTDSSWSVFDDGTSTSTSALVSGLDNDVEYQFRISAVSSAGIGETSAIITGTPKASEITEQPDVEESVPTIKEEEPVAEPTTEPEPAVEKVPSWVKNNAEWWAQGQINEETFVNGIEYLVNNEIINVPKTQTETKQIPSFVDETKDPQHYIDRYNNEEKYREWFDDNYSDYTIYEAVGVKQPVPNWVKNNADWWAQGLITEDDFLKGIEYLVNKSIIDIS